MKIKHFFLKHSSFLPSLVLFFAFFLLYASMAAPELDWGDAGGMQLAAWTAGLVHPTGYPLFLMLGWLWTHLLALFGVAPTRAMTLFSVTAGAATVAAIVPMMFALFERAKLALSANYLRFVAICAAIFFGLSHTFWSQALLAEVYTFHLLLLVLLLWALWATPRQGETLTGNRYTSGLGKIRLYGLAFFYGIALSHHRTMILWAPGLLLWLWLEQRDAFQPRRLLMLVALVALPQVVYLYIAWRGVVTPYLHQSLTNTETLTLYDGSWRTFMDYILGTVFASDLGLKEPLAERLAGVRDLAYANVIFSWLVLLLTFAMSLIGWSDKDKRVTLPLSDRLLLVSGGVMTLLFGIIYAIADVEVMFIPVWLVITILTFTGAAIWAAGTLGRGNQQLLSYLIGFLLISLIGTQLYTIIPHSRADHTAPRRLVNELLSTNPPPNAILVSNDRNEMVPVWYTQFAEGQRADILALFPLITPAPEHQHVSEVVNWALQWERPVFLTKSMPGLALRYELEPYSEPLVRVKGPAIMPTNPVLQSDLAPELSLIAWAPSASQTAAGDTVTLSIALQANTAIEHNLSFSLQLFRADGSAITQQDISPDPFYPSSDWPIGEPLRLQLPLTIPADAAEGPCEWRLSAYVLKDDGFESIGQQVIVAQFELEAAP